MRHSILVFVGMLALLAVASATVTDRSAKEQKLLDLKSAMNTVSILLKDPEVPESHKNEARAAMHTVSAVRPTEGTSRPVTPGLRCGGRMVSCRSGYEEVNCRCVQQAVAIPLVQLEKAKNNVKIIKEIIKNIKTKVAAQMDKVDHLKKVLAHSEHELKVSPKSEPALAAVNAGKQAVKDAETKQRTLEQKFTDKEKELKKKQNKVKEARQVVIQTQQKTRDTPIVRQGEPTPVPASGKKGPSQRSLVPTAQPKKQPSQVNLNFVNLLKVAATKEKEMVHQRHEGTRDAALTAKAKVELSKEEVKRLNDLISATAAQVIKLKEATAKADNEVLKAKHAAKYAITQQETAVAQKLLEEARVKRNLLRKKLNRKVIKEAKIVKNKERAEKEVVIAIKVSGKAQAEVSIINAAKAAKEAAKAQIQAALAVAAARRRSDALAADAAQDGLRRQRAQDQVGADKSRAAHQHEQYLVALKAMEAHKKKVAELMAAVEVAMSKRKAEQARVAAKLAKEQKAMRDQLARIHADQEQQKAAKAKMEAQRAADAKARERKLWLAAQDQLSRAMAERQQTIARQEAQAKQMRAQKAAAAEAKARAEAFQAALKKAAAQREAMVAAIKDAASAASKKAAQAAMLAWQTTLNAARAKAEAAAEVAAAATKKAKSAIALQVELQAKADKAAAAAAAKQIAEAAAKEAATKATAAAKAKAVAEAKAKAAAQAAAEAKKLTEAQAAIKASQIQAALAKARAEEARRQEEVRRAKIEAEERAMRVRQQEAAEAEAKQQAAKRARQIAEQKAAEERRLEQARQAREAELARAKVAEAARMLAEAAQRTVAEAQRNVQVMWATGKPKAPTVIRPFNVPNTAEQVRANIVAKLQAFAAAGKTRDEQFVTAPGNNAFYTQFGSTRINMHEDWDIQFSARGTNDVHVALLPQKVARSADAWEVVFGGWGNTRSVIRSGTQGVELASYNDATTVGPASQWRAYWLSFNADTHVLSVWTDNKEEVVMAATMPEIDPRADDFYVGVAAWDSDVQFKMFEYVDHSHHDDGGNKYLKQIQSGVVDSSFKNGGFVEQAVELKH